VQRLLVNKRPERKIAQISVLRGAQGMGR